MGLSSIMWYFIGLPASEGASEDGIHLLIGVMSGVASRLR
jgi:hypothetical protein